MFQRWIADSETGGRASFSGFGADVGETVFEIIDILNRPEVPA